MSKCLLTLMLVFLVSLPGLALAQDPPANDGPPVRLKKRKPNNEDKPRGDPDKAEERKRDDNKGEKKEEQKTEPREAEPVTPQEEEKEVLQRVVTNVQRVGERLAKSDLGEATQQTQRDILKDLESLINRNENPPPQGGSQQDQNNGGGGGSDNQNNPDQQGGGGQQNQKQKSGGRKSQSQSKDGGKGQGQSNGGQKSSSGGSGTQPGAQSKPGNQKGAGNKLGQEKHTGKDEKGGEKPGGKDGKNGNGSGGGRKDDRERNKNADLDKQGVWGHLPQTLRAQMDAYSNPQPFMPKYDDLIKRYYRTISEQGRRKGE